MVNLFKIFFEALFVSKKEDKKGIDAKTIDQAKKIGEIVANNAAISVKNRDI